WAHAIDLEASDSTFDADAVEVAGQTLDLSGSETTVKGNLTNLQIAGLVSGSAKFEISKRGVTVTTGDETVDATLVASTVSSPVVTVTPRFEISNFAEPETRPAIWRFVRLPFTVVSEPLRSSVWPATSTASASNVESLASRSIAWAQ